MNDEVSTRLEIDKKIWQRLLEEAFYKGVSIVFNIGHAALHRKSVFWNGTSKYVPFFWQPEESVKAPKPRLAITVKFEPVFKALTLGHAELDITNRFATDDFLVQVIVKFVTVFKRG